MVISFVYLNYLASGAVILHNAVLTPRRFPPLCAARQEIERLYKGSSPIFSAPGGVGKCRNSLLSPRVTVCGNAQQHPALLVRITQR